MVTLNAHFDGKAIIPDEPTGLAAGSRLRVTVETIEFFIDIHFVRVHHEFLFESIVIGLSTQSRNAFCDTRANPRGDLRQTRPYGPRGILHCLATLLNEFANARAFACAHVVEFGECRMSQFDRSGEHRRKIALGLANHTRQTH